MTVEKINATKMPNLQTSELVINIPADQAGAFARSPHNRVIGGLSLEGEQNYYVDSAHSNHPKHFYIDGHLRYDTGFRQTTFDIRMPGVLRGCFAKALGREPSATVYVTQYPDVNPGLHQGAIERYARLNEPVSSDVPEKISA